MDKTHIITLCPLYHSRPEREIESKVKKTVYFLLEMLERYWSKCELNMSCFLCSAPRVCVKTTDAEAHQVKKLSLVVITFFAKFSQTVEFSEEGGKSGDETENKEPGSFQKKKKEKKI